METEIFNRILLQRNFSPSLLSIRTSAPPVCTRTLFAYNGARLILRNDSISLCHEPRVNPFDIGREAGGKTLRFHIGWKDPS